MPKFGPVSRDVFDAAAGDEAAVSHAPRDAGFGVLDAGGRAVAAATRPLVVPPSLGLGRAARFAVDRLVSGVAASGLPPTHLSVTLTLPPETTDAQFETFWTAVDAAAREAGVSVATGHTGRYDGCASPMVGSGTAMAVGDAADVVCSDGASPGDRIVVTGGPAIGAAGLLAGLDGPSLREELADGTVAAAADRVADANVVDAALTAAAGPVTAMRAGDEGGVVGGLFGMARAADARFEVATAAIPVPADVAAVCDAAGVDPWTAFGAGALLLTVEASGVGDVLDALEAAGVPAAEAGRVVEGAGLTVDGEAVTSRGGDPVWAAVTALGA